MASSRSDIHRVLHKGQTALWLPFELREQADAQTNWDVTSDSLALDLARRLNAERLVVVKACTSNPGHARAAGERARRRFACCPKERRSRSILQGRARTMSAPLYQV